MSHHPQSAAAQPRPASGHVPDHPELEERIRRFQEAAQALLNVYAEPGTAEPQPVAQAREVIQANAAGQAGKGSAGGETRCYYFSPGAVQHEQELLKRYNAEDFQALLAEAYGLLVGVIKIMKCTHPDVRVKGYVISSLGCLLEQASVLVLRMRNVYARVEKVGQ